MRDPVAEQDDAVPIDFAVGQLQVDVSADAG